MRVYDYTMYLREVAELVPLTSLLTLPSRDVNDIIVLQTAILGDADILRSRDDDFYNPPAATFLDKAGVAVMDDIALLHRLRS